MGGSAATHQRGKMPHTGKVPKTSQSRQPTPDVRDVTIEGTVYTVPARVAEEVERLRYIVVTLATGSTR